MTVTGSGRASTTDGEGEGSRPGHGPSLSRRGSSREVPTARLSTGTRKARSEGYLPPWSRAASTSSGPRSLLYAGEDDAGSSRRPRRCRPKSPVDGPRVPARRDLSGRPGPTRRSGPDSETRQLPRATGRRQMAGGAVGAEAGEDVPGGQGGELAQGPDPEPDQKVCELDPVEDADRPWARGRRGSLLEGRRVLRQGRRSRLLGRPVPLGQRTRSGRRTRRRAWQQRARLPLPPPPVCPARLAPPRRPPLYTATGPRRNTAKGRGWVRRKLPGALSLSVWRGTRPPPPPGRKPFARGPALSARAGRGTR